MASLSRLIEVLLRLEKESPDERKVIAIGIIRSGLTSKPVTFKIMKVRETKDTVFLDLLPKKKRDRV